MRNFTYSPSTLALVLTSLVVTSAFAVDGTITINGRITDTTCSISVDGGSANATVTLPTVSTSSLTAAGETAGTTPFSISLNGCTGVSLNTAQTYFEPGAFTDSNTGRLNIDDNVPDAAQNVQIQLLNANRQSIAVGASIANGQNDIPVDISGSSGTLNYFAQYYATGPSIAGSVTTQVDYTMIYE